MPDEAIEYRVKYESRSKQEFVILCREMGQKGFQVRLRGTEEEATLDLRRSTPRKASSIRIPSTLFLLTISSIIVSSWIQAGILVQLVPLEPLYLLITPYLLGLVGVLVFHELAHQYLARAEGQGTHVAFFLPGLPISLLPTFGAFSFMRDPPVNRDSLFRIAFVGPLVGILLTCVVAAVGSFTQIAVAPAQFTQILGVNGTASVSELNLSVLQSGISSLLSWAGLVPATPQGYQTIASPATAAAWAGFFISALALLPAVRMDGGHLAESIFGYRRMRITTYGSVLLLLLLDTPNYFLPAILILLVAGRAPETSPLDEISAVSGSKKALFAVSLLLILLAMPIPQRIGIFSLT